MSVEGDEGHLAMGFIRALAFALSICVVINSLGANERLIRGKIEGIDPAEGAWIGIVTEAPSYRIGLKIPHDEFGSIENPEARKNWSFSPNGDFELTTQIEEEAVLLVVAKNRLPTEVALHPDVEESPIVVSVSSGVGLKGTVRSEDGKPVVGATISVTPGDKNHEIPSFALPKWDTAADGSFELGGLKGRKYYTLGVTAEGYASFLLSGFAIPENGINGLEIQLEKGYFVSGKVLASDGERLPDIDIVASWSRDAVKVVESDGEAKLVGGEGWNTYRTGTRTKSDGSFRMGPFAKGTTGRLYADSSSMGSTITQHVSAPFENLILRLGQESVRGRVLDATSGVPIEKFWVSTWVGERRSHDVESSNGAFDLPVYAVEEDGTEITISAPGYSSWTRLMFRGTGGEYDLGDVTLEKERTIRGTVRNAETGSPLANVTIFGVTNRRNDPYEDPPENNWAYSSLAESDGIGSFTLDHVSPRVESLHLIAGRGRFASIDLPTEVDELDIELDFSGVLEGSLILPDRTAVEGIIEIKGSSWWLPWKIKTDGSFRIEGLTPDTYTLAVKSDAGLVEKRTVTLKTGERLTDYDLVVQPGWTATGTISGLEGIEYVLITALDSDSRELTRKRFRNGEYAIRGLPPEVTLVARSSSGHTLVREFLNGNAQGSAVDFRIEDEARLTGWLTSGGEPVGGISLQIKPKNSDAVATNVTTTESGRYEARRLADGKHVIHTDTGHLFEVDVSGDTTFDMEVPENMLSGVVRGDRSRTPISGGRVKLVMSDTSEDGRRIEIVKRVGSDGTFLFEGLVTGDYDISLEHPRAETVTSRIRVSGLETIELEVQCANTRECFEGSSDDQRLAIAN